ncbi:MAG TPA: hypothetical protein VGM25_15215 [Caulobacteraceae bacterium]|jgi:hypothetical protein
MDRTIDLVADARKRSRKAAPAWLFLLLAALASALVAYGWTLLPPPDVFGLLVRLGGPTWAAFYVMIEGTVIGVAVWVAVYLGLFREQASVKTGLILLAATVLPALAVSDVARFHYLDVLRYQQIARRAAARHHAARDRLTIGLDTDMDQLALFDISYRAWTVHPADFPRFEANLVKARMVLRAYQALAGDAQRTLQADIRRLPMPRGEQDRMEAVAARDMDQADWEAFWTTQNQELDETASLLKALERANGGKLDEADFARHQSSLFALIKASNQRYRHLSDAEEARERALVAAVR